MWKTNMETNLYDVNKYKYEHEKNMTRLWCEVVPKINVEYTKGNEGSYFYLYPFRDLIQRSFQRGFYVCIK
jgi:hypothetical protein